MRLRRFVGIGFLAISLCVFPTTRSNRHPSQLRHRLTTRNKHYFLKSTFWKHNNFTIAHRISWDFFFPLYTSYYLSHTPHSKHLHPSLQCPLTVYHPTYMSYLFLNPHTRFRALSLSIIDCIFFFPLLFLVLCKLDLSLFLISSCFRALFSNILLLLISIQTVVNFGPDQSDWGRLLNALGLICKKKITINLFDEIYFDVKINMMIELNLMRIFT